MIVVRHAGRGIIARLIGMIELEISNDTSEFEVPAVLDGNGVLTDHCVRQAVAKMEIHGLVILTDCLSGVEANEGLDLIRNTIEDPEKLADKLDEDDKDTIVDALAEH